MVLKSCEGEPRNPICHMGQGFGDNNNPNNPPPRTCFQFGLAEGAGVAIMNDGDMGRSR